MVPFPIKFYTGQAISALKKKKEESNLKLGKVGSG